MGNGGSKSKKLNLFSPYEQPFTAKERDTLKALGDWDAYGYEGREEITDDQRYALYEYTESSVGINSALADAKGDQKKLKEPYKNRVRHMDAAIKQFGFNNEVDFEKEEGGLFRGARYWALGIPQDKGHLYGEALADYINENRLGTTNVNYGYTSTATDINAAKGFGGNKIILEFQKIGKGVRGIYLSDQHNPLSAFGSGEREVLMGRNLVTIPRYAWVGNDGWVHVAVDARLRKRGE